MTPPPHSPDISDTWWSGGEEVTATTEHNGTETRVAQQARHDVFVTWLKLPENFPED